MCVQLENFIVKPLAIKLLIVEEIVQISVKYSYKLKEKSDLKTIIVRTWIKGGKSVMNKLRITISVEDDNGNAVVASESSREIPTLEGFQSQGFRKAFGVLENAVLDARKEASDAAVEQYLEDMSKKTQLELPQGLHLPE